jgi:hypothetical protein
MTARSDLYDIVACSVRDASSSEVNSSERARLTASRNTVRWNSAAWGADTVEQDAARHRSAVDTAAALPQQFQSLSHCRLRLRHLGQTFRRDWRAREFRFG